jgi:predicted Fe-Mo cluster-binding NifX family protein
LKIKIACATDDEIGLSKDHFGSARVYLIYELNCETGEMTFLEKINNTTEEERGHGDPVKAKGVSGLMKGIDVLVGLAMGTNIARIRKNFVPVISRKKDIVETLEKLKEKVSNIRAEIDKATGEKRTVIIIK